MVHSVLHLSDLHLGAENSTERMQKLVSAILARFKGGERPVIVITGDLVNSPFGDSYRKAEKHFDQLRNAGFSVLVVPGNHDYGFGFFNWPPYERKFRQTFLRKPEAGYPRLDILGDIAFIGLDSSAAELHFFDLLGPNGEIGKSQLRKLAALLENSDVRKSRHRVLYMHHHPNDSGTFMGLKDWKPLHQLIDRPGLFTAVLFGHRHLVVPKGKAAREPFQHIARAYDGGASLQKKGYPQGPHRLIHLDQPPETDIDLKLLG